MKNCSACRLPKEDSEFCADRSQKDGRACSCRGCRRISLKKSRLKHPEHRLRAMEDYRKHPHKAAARHRRRKYGITPEDFDRMLRQQDRKCAICSAIHKKLCVDHDHSTGKVRALICRNCNTGIGNLGDSAALLRKAADYLETYL